MNINLEDIIYEEDDLDCDNIDDEEVDNILLEDSDSSVDNVIEEPLMDGSFARTRSSVAITTPLSTPQHQKTEAPEVPSPRSPMIPAKKVDPLDLFHEHESIEMDKTDKKLHKTLSNKRKFSNKKHPVVSYDEIPPISYKIAGEFSGIFPTSLAVSSKYIAVGNSNSQVLIFSSEGNYIRDIEIKRKEFGEVASMDIDQEEKSLVAGFEKGQFALWKIKSGSCIRACNTLHRAPVISLSFFKKSRQNFLTADAKGKIISITIAKSRFSVSMKTQVVSKGDLGTCMAIKPLIERSFSTGVFSLIALGTLLVVNIYNSEEDLELIFNILKPEGAMNGMVPCISWSESDRFPTLAVAWGLSITLYEMRKPSREFINIIGMYDMKQEIKGIEWLDSEIMIGISKMREIRVINAKEFGKIRKQHSAEDTMPKDIVPQMYVRYEDGKENMTLFNSFKALPRCVYILGKKEFSVCRLLNWKECIENMVNKKEWTDALCFGLDVFQKKIEMFANADPQETRIHLENLITDYVRTVNFPVEQKIPNCIEFCIAIDALDILFNDFFEYFIDKGTGRETLTLFMDTLEPHIISKEIRCIPPVILGRIVGYYLSIQRTDILQRVILHLDPRSLNVSQILPVCNDSSMTTCQIFLSTNTNDFESPFKTLLKYMAEVTDKLQIRQIAYKLLWFIRLCLRGELFPEGQISEADYPPALEKILECFLEKSENVLGKLISIDTQATLDVIWEAFCGRARTTYTAHSRILERLEEEVHDQNGYQLTMFIAKVATVEQSAISKQTCLNTVKKLLKPYRRTFNRSFAQAHDIHKFIDMASNVDSYTSEREYSIEEKGELMLKMVKNCDLEESELDELLKAVVSSPYTELLVYLHELKGKYRDCIRIFVRCENESIKLKIFDWFYHIRYTLGEQQFNEVLLEEIMDYLNILVQIDTDKTAKIVREWFTEGHVEIIGKLNDFPELQMKYLAEIVNSEDCELDDDVILKYIELLCVHAQEDLIPFLVESQSYPITEALEISKKHNVFRATAFLHERLGDFKNALKVYLDILDEICKNLPVKRPEKEILKTIDECFAICSRNAKNLDESDNRDLWFPLISHILNMYNEFLHSPVFPKIESIISSSLKRILESMIDHIAFEKIITYIDGRFGSVPFKYFKETFIGLLSRMSYQTNILKTATNLLNSDIKNMTQDLYQMRKKGISSHEFLCAACKRDIDIDKMMKGSSKLNIFICGHAYHGRCIPDDHCTLCSENNL